MKYLTINSGQLTMEEMSNDKGQVILILILVMTVALAIGLSIVQKSLVDVSTASKVEQSSRAFSAAEAGIEKAIQADTAITSSLDLGNSSMIHDVQRSTVPAANQALEYSPITKEEIAQVWLADPSTNDLSASYTGTKLDIYWGNVGVTGADKPAIEITVVYQDTFNVYRSYKYFYDQDAVSRNNGFTSPDICPSDTISTSLTPTPKSFFCKKQIDVSASTLPGLNKLILLRARILYSGTSQSFAVQPATGFSLPVQARSFTSTGISGETQRKVNVFQLYKVVPSYFDYAIFSAGAITK